jgi:hypothetical protein
VPEFYSQVGKRFTVAIVDILPPLVVSLTYVNK